MKKVAFIIFDGIEESEFIVAHDVFFRAGYDLSLFGLNKSNSVTSRSGIEIKYEKEINHIDVSSFDLLYISGGPGVEQIKLNNDLINLVKSFDLSKKYIAAICAAPSVLINSGIMDDTEHTCHPSVYDFSVSKTNLTSKDDIVIDQRIFTAKNFTNTLEFSMKIVEKLSGKDFAIKLKEGF